MAFKQYMERTRLSTNGYIFGLDGGGEAEQSISMGARPSKLAARVIGVRGKQYRRLGRGSAAVGPAQPPKGYVPVCVGVNDDEAKRFIVHTTLLSEDDFLELLVSAAEEYGFCNEGVLRIPYEAKVFEEWVVERGKERRVKPAACRSTAVCFSGKRVQVWKLGLQRLRAF